MDDQTSLLKKMTGCKLQSSVLNEGNHSAYSSTSSNFSREPLHQPNRSSPAGSASIPESSHNSALF